MQWAKQSHLNLASIWYFSSITSAKHAAKQLVRTGAVTVKVCDVRKSLGIRTCTLPKHGKHSSLQCALPHLHNRFETMWVILYKPQNKLIQIQHDTAFCVKNMPYFRFGDLQSKMFLSVLILQTMSGRMSRPHIRSCKSLKLWEQWHDFRGWLIHLLAVT